MSALNNVCYQHSYVLMFFCLCLLLHPAFVKFRFLVLARDDIVGTCGILWVLTVFLTEEHKNKRGH